MAGCRSKLPEETSSNIDIPMLQIHANTISKEKSRVKSSGNTVRHERWNIQNVANDEENQHRRNPDNIPNHNGCLNILESAMGCDGFGFGSRETAAASQRSGQRVYGESRSAAPEPVAARSCDACHAKQLRPRSLRRFNLPGQTRRATKIHQCHTCHVNNQMCRPSGQTVYGEPDLRKNCGVPVCGVTKCRACHAKTQSPESLQRVTKCRCLKEKRRKFNRDSRHDGGKMRGSGTGVFKRLSIDDWIAGGDGGRRRRSGGLPAKKLEPHTVMWGQKQHSPINGIDLAAVVTIFCRA